MIRHLIVHNKSRELRSRPWLYKNHKCSRNKQKSPYSKKDGNHFLFLGLEFKKKGRFYVHAAEERTTTSVRLTPFEIVRQFCIVAVRVQEVKSKMKDKGKLYGYINKGLFFFFFVRHLRCLRKGTSTELHIF